jgi:hypothetical protein
MNVITELDRTQILHPLSGFPSKYRVTDSSRKYIYIYLY